ncbi:MAG: transcriptional repressor LexA [Candidatus Omnitrophica bacterium]|nr:transcriptional repressor LexA [Candidatus Omnitrophota bacterium]
MKIIRDLTTKQAAILKFLQNKVTEEGRPPTIREIGERFAFRSTGTTRDHLKSLSQKGYIRLKARQSRSIELVRPMALRIPVLGKIMAGKPDLALEEIIDYVHLDEFISSQDRQVFALKIKGDSMIDKGIHEGDIAVIRAQRLASEGDIVAALLDQEATIKILKKKGGSFILAPANSKYCEIHKPFTILGKVVAVIKKF